jgi:acyl carrier protein
LRAAIAAGYRPTRKEIEIQVRLIVAANLGIPLERVTPEMSFTDDLTLR